MHICWTYRTLAEAKTRAYRVPEASRRHVACVEKMTRRILYIQFTDPAGYPSLEHSSRLLADRGWEVLMVGATRRELNLRIPDYPGIRVKTIRFVRGGWRQKAKYTLFFFLTLYWTWWWRPEWIYASDPLACPVVWLVRKIRSIKIVYHEHDSPNPNSVESSFMREVFAFRGRLAKDAEICILPEQTRLLQLLETTRRTKPAFCVWNCPQLHEMADLSLDERHIEQAQKLIIYYHGSITIDRLPAQLIVAASRFKGAVRVRVAGYEAPGHVGYIRTLMEVAARNGAAEMIELLGTIPLRRDLLRSASKSHVGLAFMPKKSEDINMQHMVGASNKPFDYMACGLPLLVTDLPEWVRTFADPGYARACDPNDPDSIEAELRWYMEHPDERREMGRRGQNKIRQTWNYESVFSDVLAEIERGAEGVVCTLDGSIKRAI
jgi:glycosyltransferase involved in cell wall biosynthesis